MVDRRRGTSLRERARGVGLAVGLGLLVCAGGLALSALMVWVMT